MTTRGKIPARRRVSLDAKANLLDLLARGCVFGSACRLVGYYPAEALREADRLPGFKAQLDEALAAGEQVFDKAQLYLELLGDGLTKSRAMRLAGLSPVLLHGIASQDPEWRLKVEQAFAEGTDTLADIATRRGAESSDNLLMFTLKSRDPARFRDTLQQVVHHDAGKLEPHSRELIARRIAFALRDAIEPAGEARGDDGGAADGGGD